MLITVCHLICALLHLDPKMRMTVAQALQHPWITSDLDWLRHLYRRLVLHDKP
jgi:serine/threonine protein kinase